jgi:ketosteroid isomerase-like protein
MTRSFVCASALLLSCCLGFAQEPAPARGGSAGAAATIAAPEVQQFQKVEDAWSTAVNARDQYGLELVLSPMFVDISASGDITTRNQQLAQVIGGEDKTLHLEQRVITVRLLGDIAVANGTYILHHKAGASTADERGVFTHVFERVHGNWVCVNSQRTVLREDAPNSKSKKKSSEAELPFHIPLFSKGDKSQ